MNLLLLILHLAFLKFWVTSLNEKYKRLKDYKMKYVTSILTVLYIWITLLSFVVMMDLGHTNSLPLLLTLVIIGLFILSLEITWHGKSIHIRFFKIITIDIEM